MQRFSCVRILCFLCISHDLLILLAISDEAASCSTTMPLMQCKTPPFGFEGLCAVSESFLKSHCSSSDHAYWDAFEDATPYVHLIAPEITGIYHTQPEITYVNLVWDIDRVDNLSKCPIYAAEYSDIIPEVINITTFANGAFQFSPFNLYLLFNCGNHDNSLPTMVNVERNSPICMDVQAQCYGREIMACVQLNPFQELTLSHVLYTLSCTHFLSLANNTPLPPDWNITKTIDLPDWSTGVVQLVYGDGTCEACLNSRGQCIFNEATRLFEMCVCGENQVSETICQHGCKGFSCTRVKIVTGLAVAVGTTVVVSLILLALCCLAHTRKYFAIQKVRKRLRMQEVPGSNPSFSHLSLDGLTERTVEYSYASIVSATNSFTNVLGEGGFGVVYKGTLTHANDDLHMQIAVKVLHVRSKHSKKQFLNEVATIGRIHNVHVVRLLGICIQQNHEILVYEYVINGSLDNWLFNHNQVLHWGQRYAIAVGIAKGLCYLHEECRHRIVHCDIKPGNILLDGQMCPKIADFGLARLMSREESRVATLARGTPGYMAPEFWMGGESQLSTKFDVYSYGMVLLELMSGRRNFSNGLNFPEVAFQAAMRGDFESIMDVKLGITKPHDDDQSMKLDGVQWQQVRTALLVALWCIQDHPGSRPSMSEVVQYLEGNATINEQPPPPAIASTLAVSAQQHPYLSNNRHYSITPISSGR